MRFLREAGILLATMLLTGVAASLLLRQDANWDLRNYHFYNGWAFTHDRLGWDLAPAQLQTFHNPLLDLPFYGMVAADWKPRLISFVMVMPAAVGWFFLAKILLLLFRDLPDKERRSYVILTFLVGISATGAVAVLGSTMNDWPGATLVVIALWMLLQRSQQQHPRWQALVAAGVIAGIASGLKLTNATYAVGLCAAVLTRKPILSAGIRDAALFGVAVIAGVLLSSGAWMWTLYSHFESPLFPYFNDIFRSPWWDPTRIHDPRFGPHSLFGWLTYPIPLFGYSANYVTEARFRDWRMPLIYLAWIAALVTWLVRRARRLPTPQPAIAGSSDAWRLLLVFCGVSWLLWAKLYSIYRYLVPLELVSGAVLIYVLALTVPRRWLSTAATVAAILAIATARYPSWGRIEYGDHFFSIRLPPIAPHALVMSLSDEPTSFVLPFFPADGRFVGANNNFNDPWRKNRLAETIVRVVREHRGPLYSLTSPAGSATAALDAYRLRRAPGGCASIESNMSSVPFELCRLERIDAVDQPGAGATARETAR